MDWRNKDGDKYTDRNSPDIELRAKWFDKILPKKIKHVFELGCNKGHNLQAIAKVRDVYVSGREINKKSAKIARSRGLWVNELTSSNAELILCSGVLMHINPIDLMDTFCELDNNAHRYILMVEHKEDSIRTINTRWYKNALWVMDTGKEFMDRFPNWKCIKKGWCSGKKPKELDYTAPYDPKKLAYHPAGYYWLLKRR